MHDGEEQSQVFSAFLKEKERPQLTIQRRLTEYEEEEEARMLFLLLVSAPSHALFKTRQRPAN